jgi:hypothetical protein
LNHAVDGLDLLVSAQASERSLKLLVGDDGSKKHGHEPCLSSVQKSRLQLAASVTTG